LIADQMPTNNSGAEVPKATTVKPMTKVEMPNLRDKKTAAVIKYCAPQKIKAKPIIKMVKLKAINLILLISAKK
ncbi:MAG: hypothetical protein Q8O41_06690, partial [Candidatus Methanoperedens sp.]|nr:hypothetical protein [Candidatus Methanoperedens sp.]